MSNFAQDMRIKTAWGMTLTQWNRLSTTDRKYYRENLTSAPYFEDTK